MVLQTEETFIRSLGALLLLIPFIELVQVHLPDNPLPLCCVLSFLWKGF